MTISRRSFMQSVAAALAATAMGSIYKPQAPAIRYELFTDPFYHRWDLDRPFEVDELVCATDRAIILTHPGGGHTGNGDRKIPNISNLQWSEFDSGGWSELGSRPVITDGDGHCPKCFGFGRIGDFKPCWCDEIEFDDFGESIGPCTVCKDSQYTGGVKCDQCNGGCIESGGREIVAGHVFNTGFVQKIRTLGTVDVKAIPYADSGVLLFRGAHGVRGMLCGMDLMK